MLISVSECLLFNANSAICQLYHGENKLIFNEMMMKSALYKTNKISPLIDMSPHWDTLSWFRTNQSLLFLLNATSLAQSNNYQFIVFGLTRSGLDPTIYGTQGENANNYTIDTVVLVSIEKIRLISYKSFQCRNTVYSVDDTLETTGSPPDIANTVKSTLQTGHTLWSTAIF